MFVLGDTAQKVKILFLETMADNKCTSESNISHSSEKLQNNDDKIQLIEKQNFEVNIRKERIYVSILFIRALLIALLLGMLLSFVSLAANVYSIKNNFCDHKQIGTCVNSNNCSYDIICNKFGCTQCYTINKFNERTMEIKCVNFHQCSDEEIKMYAFIMHFIGGAIIMFILTILSDISKNISHWNNKLEKDSIEDKEGEITDKED